MNSENLAIVFAPNLLQSNLPQTVQEVMSETKHSNNLMQTLIQEAELIFGPRPKKPKQIEEAETAERMSRVLLREYDEYKNMETDTTSAAENSPVRKKSLTRKPIGTKRWNRSRGRSLDTEKDKKEEEVDDSQDAMVMTETSGTPRSTATFDDAEEEVEEWEEGIQNDNSLESLA